MKIIHYGFLANRAKQKLKVQQTLTGILPQTRVKDSGIDKTVPFKPMACPCCKTGRMITILVFAANDPPPALPKQTITKQTNEK